MKRRFWTGVAIAVDNGHIARRPPSVSLSCAHGVHLVSCGCLKRQPARTCISHKATTIGRQEAAFYTRESRGGEGGGPMVPKLASGRPTLGCRFLATTH